MRLIIFNTVLKQEKVYENMPFVPPIGSRINDFYQPLPTVTSVIYDYENSVVAVTCE